MAIFMGGSSHMPIGQRLYLRIYLALLTSLALAAGLFALAHWRYDAGRVDMNLPTLAAIAGRVAPAPDLPVAQQEAILREWRNRLRADLALYSADGMQLAATNAALPPPTPRQLVSGRPRGGRGGVFALRLADGRWLVCKRIQGHRPIYFLFAMLALIAVTIGIGAYPLVRRLTGRLERLQRSVDNWGTGQLSVRVPVEGQDEVARLAHSFNGAADRIERLVGAQKTLLANASHELRSPLARLRMACELLDPQADPALREELQRNVNELDQLVDELLLASRIDAGGGPGLKKSEVELVALAAEEAATVGASCAGTPVAVQADAKLLRRLIRNLLENARRYGQGSPVDVMVRREADAAVLDVCDRGPGIPMGQREAIFEPFYRLPGASEASGGVGLGLALVRQIAELHGGSVTCMDNPYGGSCFRVRLPLPRPETPS
jgi:signal transduction histidine kinase